MSGVEKNQVAIACTGKSRIPWYSAEGHRIMVDIFYSENCNGTIITPTNVVKSISYIFQGFVMLSDCNNDRRHMNLLHRDGVSHSNYPTRRINDLWYHIYSTNYKPQATVKQMNDSCLSFLWHRRLGCAGNSVSEYIYKHVKCIDQPLRKKNYSKNARQASQTR